MSVKWQKDNRSNLNKHEGCEVCTSTCQFNSRLAAHKEVASLSKRYFDPCNSTVKIVKDFFVRRGLGAAHV